MEPHQIIDNNQAVVKEGHLKKRNGRLRQWTDRYFVLTTSTISYKLKQDSSSYRQTFDLSPGCLVTDVTPESRVAGKKVYSFWIVWPHEKKGEKSEKGMVKKDDSEDEQEHLKSDDEAGTKAPKVKDLKHVVAQEALAHKRKKEIVTEQLELHQQYDSNVSIGAKVAAVAVGGVVVGALTAGIGLVPYFTIVGITAAASGGAMAFSFRRPMDSRLIMACESRQEAQEWKEALERQIAFVSDKLKPSLPASVDPTIISSILDRSSQGGVWKRVGEVENMRLLEHVPSLQEGPPSCPLSLPLLSLDRKEKLERSRCRRAQMLVTATCNETFLAIMNSRLWPKQGSCVVAKQVDDHLDYLGIDLSFPVAKASSVARRLCFSRFWQLDDEGVYMITYNSASSVDFPNMTQRSASSSYEICSLDSLPMVDAVVTITPRADQQEEGDEEEGEEVCEALVTCSCQLTDPKGLWSSEESSFFMNSFLVDHLVELKELLMYQRYHFSYAMQTVCPLPPPALLYLSNVSTAVSTGERDSVRKSKEKGERPVVQTTPAKQKRGVTTVQPGMEEMLLGEEGGGAQPEKLKRTERLMRLFSRRKEGGESHPPSHLLSDTRHPSPHQPPSSPSSSVSPNLQHRKTLRTHNNPATNSSSVMTNRQRRESVAKEYEQQRLSRFSRKRAPIPHDLSPPSPRHSKALPLSLQRKGSEREMGAEVGEREEGEEHMGQGERQAMLWSTHSNNNSSGSIDREGKERKEACKGRARPSHWLVSARREPRPSLSSSMRSVAKLFLSATYWQHFLFLFLPPSQRPFLLRQLRERDEEGVEEGGGFFCAANVLTVALVVALACLAMGANSALCRLLSSLQITV